MDEMLVGEKMQGKCSYGLFVRAINHAKYLNGFHKDCIRNDLHSHQIIAPDLISVWQLHQPDVPGFHFYTI